MNGIQTHDLCDAGAVLCQLSYQANWKLLKLCTKCKKDLSSIILIFHSHFKMYVSYNYSYSFIHPSRVYYELTIILWPSPSWRDSWVGSTLHWHHRGHGFESRSCLNICEAFFLQLLKLRGNCKDLSSIKILCHKNRNPCLNCWLKLFINNFY